MIRLARLLVVLTAITLASASARGAELLRYGGRPGQVAVYRLTVSATGQQVSLGERRPIRVEAEFELRQEVTATGPQETVTFTITPTVISTRDSTGAFGNGERSRFPATEITMNSLGEVLAARPLSDEHIGPYQRAFASIMTAPGVVLPTGPVAVGDPWMWEGNGVRQTSRLMGVTRGPYGFVARVQTAVSALIQIQEESVGLGLKTTVSGNETQTSVLELLTNTGVVLRNKGVARTVTNGQAALELAQGPKVFPIASDISFSFDLRLVRLDGGLVRLDGKAVRSD